MATEKMYEVFKSIYDEEADRYGKLAGRAQLYLSVITLYLGAFAFKYEDIGKFVEAHQISRYMPVSVGMALLVALLATVFAIRIRSYEGIANPEEIIENFGESPPSDSVFLDHRIADLAVATNHNSDVNNRVARWLENALWALVVGLSLHFTMFLIAWLG